MTKEQITSVLARELAHTLTCFVSSDARPNGQSVLLVAEVTAALTAPVILYRVFPAPCFRGGRDHSDQSDAAPRPQRI